jgi:hypothetical protein
MILEVFSDFLVDEQMRAPAHPEHPFRSNVNTDSGHDEHGFR